MFCRYLILSIIKFFHTTIENDIILVNANNDTLNGSYSFHIKINVKLSASLANSYPKQLFLCQYNFFSYLVVSIKPATENPKKSCDFIMGFLMDNKSYKKN